jgi:hypothetical protein
MLVSILNRKRLCFLPEETLYMIVLSSFPHVRERTLDRRKDLIVFPLAIFLISVHVSDLSSGNQRLKRSIVILPSGEIRAELIFVPV